MTTERTNYATKAESDARDMVAEFVDTMCEQWARDRKISDDFNNDYPDGDEYHHTTHVDKDYSLREASELLERLSDFEETDEGLWHGQEPRRAIATQAAFTYGNAVASEFQDIVSELNSELEELSENIKDSATGDDDADLSDETEEAVTLAGQRYLRLYCVLIESENEEHDGMVGAAMTAARCGDYTAALALADKVQESDDRYGENRARAIREAVK